MTAVQSALRFIQSLREDVLLRERLASTRPGLHLRDLVVMGAERGLVFDEASLRQAFVFDWQMRMAHWQLKARRSPTPSDVHAGAPTQ